MMSRRLLVQIHGYIAVFFLPMALLYAITGGFYILGQGGSDTRSTIAVQLAEKPVDAGAAIAAIRGELEKQGWRVPSVDDPVRPLQGGYYWMGLGEVIRLSPKGTSGEWEIYRQQNHWYKQLVEIHKDHAGTLFSVLGFGFALGMFILVVSGAFMMFQSPLYRKVATVLVIIGSIISVSAWIVSASS